MAKLVFVKKNLPMYENLPHRKSYITVRDSTVIDDKSEMLTNQYNYMLEFFPTQEEQKRFSEKTNFEYVDAATRRVKINVKSEIPPNIYPNGFDFWNNVNYAYLTHDDEKQEFLYVRERKLLNQATNLWEFTFSVDIWNTYWIQFYQNWKQTILSEKIETYVSRAHVKRFRFVLTSDRGRYLIFDPFLDLNNPLWIKENYEKVTYNKQVLYTGYATTPWTEYIASKDNIIPKAQELMIAYLPNEYDEADLNYHLWPKSNGFLTALIKNKSGELNPWNWLFNYYGATNIFWYVPLISPFTLDNKGQIDKKYIALNSLYTSMEVGAKGSWIFSGNVNLLNNGEVNPRVATVIQTPKPLMIITPPPEELPNFDEIVYPNRYRGYFHDNNGKKYNPRTQVYSPKQVNIENKDTVVLSNSESYINIENLYNDYNNKTSFQNMMCDERLSLSTLLSGEIQEYFVYRTSGLKKQTRSQYIYEPKCLSDDTLNVEYSHMSQEPLIISPWLYFFNNLSDLLKWKSIFIRGYQYVQPHIVILFQTPDGGLYAINNTAMPQFGLYSSFFSPVQQFSYSVYDAFIASNTAQMNAALNAQRNNNTYSGWTSGISNIIGGAAAGATAGTMINPGIGTLIGAVGGAALGISNTVTGIGKGWMALENMQHGQYALKQDLLNTSNLTTITNGDNTFKNTNSFYGVYQVKVIYPNEIDFIHQYHQRNGYIVGREMNIITMATRIYYNFWQIPNIKRYINLSKENTQISSAYLQYFENLFESGFTLWHNYYGPEGSSFSQNTVGYYENENWDIDIMDYLN